MTLAIELLLKTQDGLITRQQALESLSQAEISSRLGKFWQVVLPGVYAGFTGALTARHRMRAALLHAGPGALVNDQSALRAYRVPFVPDDMFSRVLVGAAVQRSSGEFVVVRRTTRLPKPTVVDGLPTVPLERALCEFVARHPDERDGFAVLAAAVQRRQVGIERLTVEITRSANRGRPKLVRGIAKLGIGLRSVAEDDFRRLLTRSAVLPEPLWNPLIRLPGGLELRPDALFVESALVHETNGRAFHADDDAFEAMQRRNDALVAAGLTVLHNAPRRIRTESARVLAELEECHARLAGRGLPPGVDLLTM
jgi:hypothetical protein